MVLSILAEEVLCLKLKKRIELLPNPLCVFQMFVQLDDCYKFLFRRTYFLHID